MHLVDFEYNGETLSEHGLTICTFDSYDDSIDVGNNITINSVKAPNSEKHISIATSYEDNLSVEFQVCSISCETGEVSELAITDEQLNELMRWLNRRGYYKFVPIYDDESFQDVYYNGTFNVKPIKIGNSIVGLNLTLQTNAPYGFVEAPGKSFTFGDNDREFVFFDTSDEIGCQYCDVTIKCLEAGNLIISNSLDTANDVIVYNCTEGETIVLKGESKIIETSSESHKTIHNDFNYRYLRIKNTYEDNKNVFTSTLKCEVSIEYSPIRKVGIVL